MYSCSEHLTQRSWIIANIFMWHRYSPEAQIGVGALCEGSPLPMVQDRYKLLFSATHLRHALFESLLFEQHPVPTIAGGKCAMTLASPSSIKYLAKAKWLCLTAYRRTTAMCILASTGEDTSTSRTPRLPLYATWRRAFFEVTLIFPVGRNEE
jgi:hypothetical protein